jgi:long-chain acyl-CoA synthetase
VTLFPLDSFPSGRPAAIDDAGRELSYGALLETSAALAKQAPSKAVALVLTRNSLGCIASIVSMLRNGVVPILLDASARSETVEQYLIRYRPELLSVPSNMEGLFTGYTGLLRTMDYEVLAAISDFAIAPPHEDLALLLSTSGSTGSPKLVRQSRSNLQANAKSIAAYLHITPDDRPITSLPLHYTYGFSVLSSHLHSGATLLVTDRSVMEKPFWHFFDEARATSLAGVPYTYQMLRRLGFLQMARGSLRTLTQAGGKLPVDLIREFAEYAARVGVGFYVMYGQTEATARMSFVPAERAIEKAGSIGVAIPGGELFLADEEGNEIAKSGTEGQLGYRGPNVTMGYAEHRVDLCKGDERKGVLLTGDLARRDVDGYYFISGRQSRIVKLFGKRVSLDDLEQICLGVVDEAACSGVDDSVKVWITDEQHQADLPRFLAERTAIHASAYHVRVVPKLPRTVTGKIDYRALSDEDVSA